MQTSVRTIQGLIFFGEGRVVGLDRESAATVADTLFL